MIGPEEIERRTTYHKPTDGAVLIHEQVRLAIKNSMTHLDTVIPDCREKSIAFTKLEEAMYHANAAVARNHNPL